jgi:hypothetical protein
MLFSSCQVSDSSTVNKPKVIKVFLLGGQSNMAGAGNSKDLKPPYNQPFAKIKTWNNKTKSWLPLTPKGRFGPEVYFAHSLASKLPNEKIRLIKSAQGGTALYNDWSPITKGGPYRNFMKTTKAAIADLDASGVKYEIAGMLWLQGESDANEKKGDSYEKNITYFISHMRKEFKTKDMPFIIARICDNWGRKSGHAKFVRDAQMKVAKTIHNVACFDTDDCAISGGHYISAGLAVIGNRFSEKYIEINNRHSK